jgi:enoyl-CoA hydratase/carnithine racemase
LDFGGGYAFLLYAYDILAAELCTFILPETGLGVIPVVKMMY